MLFLIAFAQAAGNVGIPAPDYFWLSVKFVLALVVVGVGLYYGLKFLLGRMAFRYGAGAAEGWMEVIDRVYIDGKNYVALVRVGMKYLVLGVSDKGINLLMELDERPAGNVLHEGGFKRYLQKFVSKS